jgi:Zn-dependent M16 (insulinase) family peptidase
VLLYLLLNHCCCLLLNSLVCSVDPNLLDTLEAYDGSVDFLRSLELDQDALTKAIIGTMGDLDAYQLPDAKGYTAFSRCGWQQCNEYQRLCDG